MTESFTVNAFTGWSISLENVVNRYLILISKQLWNFATLHMQDLENAQPVINIMIIDIDLNNFNYNKIVL